MYRKKFFKFETLLKMLKTMPPAVKSQLSLYFAKSTGIYKCRYFVISKEKITQKHTYKVP